MVAVKIRPIPQFTSLDAYIGLTPTHISQSQKTVYNVIARLGEATDKEIAEMGRIRCVGEKRDSQTGRRMMLWRVKS